MALVEHAKKLGKSDLILRDVPYTSTYDGDASITLYVLAYNSSTIAKQRTITLYEDGVSIATAQAYIPYTTASDQFTKLGINIFKRALKKGSVYTFGQSGDAVLLAHSCKITTTE